MNLLFGKALLGLLAYDVALRHNFTTLHSFVRKWNVARVLPSHDAVDRVCNAMNLACGWYPKRVLCLQRSAVTTCLLRGNGVPAEMVIGAQQIPFKAHAWVEVNGRAVNERTDVQVMCGIWQP